MIFVCTEFPQLRILRADGDYAVFQGGKLELDEGDPGYEEVKAEAERNPFITILVNSTTCRLCGEVFTGKVAKPNLAKHVKEVHPLVWKAEQELDFAESQSKALKHTEGYPCDVCQPVQVFGTPSDLAEHVTLLHTQPPEMDADGNETEGMGRRRPGERGVPAAKAK
jgi:hypothetical protein